MSTRGKRIVQVGSGFSPVQPGVTGGVEKYIHYLSESLTRHGHDVTVIDMPVPDRPASGYRVTEVPVRWRYHSDLATHAIRGVLFGRSAARRLVRLVRNGEVDVVNFHGQFTGVTGISAARRDGIPSVFTMHNPLWSDSAACRSMLARAKFWMEHRAEARADHVIGLSKSVTSNRVRYFELAPGKVSVVPVGVDDSWFETRDATRDIRQKYAPNGEAIVLSVGRLAPYKNQLLLAKAARRVLASVPNTRFILVGPLDSRSYVAAVQKAAADAGAGSGVVLAGTVPLAELAQLQSLASVFVLPSLLENSSQATLESMAQGKAIVASDIPPMREMLPEGTAFLVPPWDHEALAVALVELLQNEELRRATGSQARRRAYAVYHWDVIARQVAEVYEEVLCGVRT